MKLFLNIKHPIIGNNVVAVLLTRINKENIWPPDLVNKGCIDTHCTHFGIITRFGLLESIIPRICVEIKSFISPLLSEN